MPRTAWVSAAGARSSGSSFPGALGGILTGTVLAFARAAGETAPLLFLSSIYSGSTTLNIFGRRSPIFRLPSSGLGVRLPVRSCAGVGSGACPRGVHSHRQPEREGDAGPPASEVSGKMTETNFRSEQQVESSQPETDAPHGSAARPDCGGDPGGDFGHLDRRRLRSARRRHLLRRDARRARP